MSKSMCFTRCYLHPFVTQVVLKDIMTKLHFPFYFIGCPTGYYGNVCVYKCGFCAAGTACNVSNGICDHGCDVGYTGLQCLDRKFCKASMSLNISKMFPLPPNTIQLISLV
jgi:hypothetical protein